MCTVASISDMHLSCLRVNATVTNQSANNQSRQLDEIQKKRVYCPSTARPKIISALPAVCLIPADYRRPHRVRFRLPSLHPLSNSQAPSRENRGRQLFACYKPR